MSAHYGQHSGDFNASSSSLRVLYEGTRNTYSTNLTPDSFTQTNPPIVTDTNTVSTTLDAPPRGVLSASIAFTRPDGGNGFIGGPVAVAPSVGAVRPIGFFMNGTQDFQYANLPTKASNQGTYITGTLGIFLYETFVLGGGNQGDPLTWGVGDFIYASRNGYATNLSDADNAIEAALGYSEVSPLGVIKVVADSVHHDIVFDPPV